MYCNSMIDQHEFLECLRATFKVEADEHIATLTNGLVALEQAADAASQAEMLETVYREAHSLKGAARAVQRRDIEHVCQALETVLSALKQQGIQPSSALFDACHRALDVVVRLLDACEEELSADTEALVTQLTACVPQEIKAKKPVVLVAVAAAPASSPPAAQPPPALPATHDGVSAAHRAHDPLSSHKTMAAATIRVAAMRVDAILRQAEELLTAKRSTEDRAATVAELAHMLESWQKEWRRLQPEVQRVQQTVESARRLAGQHVAPLPLDTLVEFLSWNQSFVHTLQTRMGRLSHAVQQDQRDLSMMVDRLLEDTKHVLMLPFTALTEFVPKMVRDIAREQAKKIEIFLSGTEMEIDKRILEQLKTPLIHLLRNCVDHGIETPAERHLAGKPAQGTIALHVSQASGSKVQVVVTDDGRGIDAERVKRAAIASGALPETDGATRSSNNVFDVIFVSGVSTSPTVTELSGRGLGMAVVREGVEALGGTISVDSVMGKGTTFTIILPLTLATFRGVVVRIAGRQFVLPLAHVVRVARMPRTELYTLEGKPAATIDGHVTAVVAAHSVLGCASDNTNEDPEYVTLVVVTALQKRVALIVDLVEHEQEVLVKHLGRLLMRARNFSGATITGSGDIVPIVNVIDIIRIATAGSAYPAVRALPAEETKRHVPSILVVEDSITSRVLIKNILESAGYNVRTAIDGVDGMTLLREAPSDVVVSDVEMPRMDGFMLTRSIRADAALAHVPVILVTALETAQYREQGIDAGANAYIVKSSFDQSNLLATIRRFV